MSSIVASAVSHLKELENRMRLEGTNFNKDDIQNCDRIADLLEEMENEVKKLHDELEAETIRSSVLRHKFNYFNYDIKKEINDNVKAARDSNMAVIINLKEKLEELTRNIQNLHQKDKQLSEEISKMEPEKKSLIDNYENIITSLNQHMANKAEAQIKLNETRDVLRETNKAMQELEEEMIALKEQLIKDKSQARDEKIQLEEEKSETNTQAITQEDYNENKGRELEGTRKKLEESNKSLRVVFRENERLNDLIKNLESEIEFGTNDLDKKQKRLEFLTLESLRLTTLEAKIQQDYDTNKNDTINKTKEAVERTKLEAENLKQLKEEQDLKREELKKITETYKELQIFTNTTKKYIDGIRDEVGKKFQEIAEMELKNQSIYDELGIAQESHNQVMDSLLREAQEFREQLGHERDIRIKKQQLRDNQLVEIEAFNANVMNDQTNSNKYLSQGKDKYTMLTNKEKEYNEKILNDEKEKIRLTAELHVALENYNYLKLDLEEKVKKLETEIDFYEKENVKNVKEIEDMTPSYEELCKVFDEKTKDFDETRLLLIKTRNRKTTLETNIVKTKQQITYHEDSREKVKNVLKVKREETLKTMKEQNDELKELENEILHTGLKVQTIKFENDKFVQSIKESEENFKNLDSKMIETIQNREQLQSEYNKLQNDLVEGWQTDSEIERLFATEDTQLINKLNILFNKAKNRENKVNDISEKLYKELYNLENYLNIMVGKIDKSDMFDSLEKTNETTKLNTEQVSLIVENDQSN